MKNGHALLGLGMRRISGRPAAPGTRTPSRRLLQIIEKSKATVVIVTHDLAEAIYLSDRIVAMTNGLDACIEEIFLVHFDRLRYRVALTKDTDAIRHREVLSKTE